MENRIKLLGLSILFSIFLTACGGGGGSEESNNAENQAPQVSISGDTEVNELATLSLSASANDSDGSIADFSWQQTGGPSIDFAANGQQINVSIPAVDTDTDVSFSLRVTDNQGATATTSITITIINVNQAPTISVAGPQISSSSNNISLSANASDSDGEVISYDWQQTAGPDVEFENGSSTISFTTPNVATLTQLVFSVTVTDSFGEQSTALFTIDVSANSAPSVSITGSQNIQEGAEGVLTATATDSDGSIISYSWVQTLGPITEFTATDNLINYTAPEVETNDEITFQVTATDDDGATSSAEFSVVVENYINLAPVITFDAIADITELTQASVSVVVTDSDGVIADIEWQQLSGPSVDFVQNGETITFTAPEVSENTEVIFRITAVDDQGAISSASLTFMIIHVNKPPTVSDIAITTEFNESSEFTIDASDIDGDELTISFSQQLAGASITLVDATTFRYLYQPASNSISQAPFTVTVSDGTQSAQATVSVTITDTSAATVVNVSPEDAASSVSVNARVMLSMSDVMKSSSLVVNSANGVCEGSVQLSADNFETCLAIDSLEMTGPQGNDNEYFNNIEFTAAFNQATEYALRLTEDLVNFADTPALAQVVSTFTTGSNDLKITEVVAIRFSNDTPWFELYNGTDSSVNLADYSVRVKSRDSSDNSISAATIFNLPDQVIAPEEYLIVHSGFGDQLFYETTEQNKSIAFIGDIDSTVRPYWFLNGFVELLTRDSGSTVDFVRFGNDTTEPLTAGQWQTGSAPVISNVTGSSIKRDIDNTDTNSSSDWHYSQFTTPAGVNDVSCEDDSDEDGIPDCSELPGSTFSGLPLHAWGARVNQKDIFIEVDYMDSSDAGIIPHQTALEKVVSSFAEQGIVVHFDVGDLYHQAGGISVQDHDLGGGDQVTFRQYTPYNFNQGVESLFHYKMANFDMRRKPIFHYMLMANSRNIDGSAGSSGVAELSGNDLMISMGNWGLSLDNEISRNLTFNYQASTIMHELGHNLGLEHGGDESTNYKPNHLSIMNYLYQLRGLPTIGNNEGDRYYSSRYRENANCAVQTADLTNSPFDSPENFVMSYSHGLGSSIDENNIIEANGLRYPGSAAVDFNCNADLTETLSQDTNDDTAVTVLNDVDEWSLIELRFYTLFSGNRFGVHQQDSDQKDVSKHIQQRMIEEQAPPLKLLSEIKAAREKQGIK